jgi:catechol 2,3-dioxygenase-like lactoylglutathione lyase family enzyme
MAIQGVFYVFVFASDFERSKRFYGETLGWQLGTDEADVAGFAFGSGYLVLRREERPPSARSYAGGMHVGVRVDDVDAEHARLARAGVALSPLVNQPWGERNFRFADPDGYAWVYGQA